MITFLIVSIITVVHASSPSWLVFNAEGDGEVRIAISHSVTKLEQMNHEEHVKYQPRFFIFRVLQFDNGIRHRTSDFTIVFSENKTFKMRNIGSGEFDDCKSAKGFSVGQVRLCQVYNDHMEGVSAGAGAGLLECKHQFNNRRWNCSTVDDSSVFGPLNSIGSRESAFIHAIMAAGITHAIGRRCRDGQLSSCSCSRAGRPKDLHHQWIWGGCGDNLEYGYKFTQSFVDVRERERRYKRGSAEHGRALMNLHNNEAGRRAVIKMSKVTCKCHGVSGSCSLITCWQQLSTFREIGDYIMDKYDGATEVKVNTRGKLQIKDPRFGLPTPNDLIYIDESPNYCVPNPSLGSLGTQGRICNRTSQGMDGCNLMCCGRGYNTRKVSIGERCDCTFHWCCYVKCNQCYKTVDIHSCK